MGVRTIIHIIKEIKLNPIKKKMMHCGKGFAVGIGYNICGERYMHIGDNFTAGKNMILTVYDAYQGHSTGFAPELTIGNNVSFMDNCAISCINMIEIGDGCLFGGNVFITDNFHGNSTKAEFNIPPLQRKLISKGPVIIGSNVWIGRNVCIMPGVTIGDGAVIGANAVVTKDIPPETIAVGVPAVVKRRIEK